jgi:hypothetical protein
VLSQQYIKLLYIETTGFDLDASEVALIDFARAVERAAREAERERIAKHFDEWDFIDTAKTIRALQEGS